MSSVRTSMVPTANEVEIRPHYNNPERFIVYVNDEYLGYGLDKREAEMMFSGACLALEKVGLTIKTKGRELVS